MSKKPPKDNISNKINEIKDNFDKHNLLDVKNHSEFSSKLALIEQKQESILEDIKETNDNVREAKEETKALSDKFIRYELEMKDVLVKFKDEIINHVKETYTTNDRFSPVQKIVYGLVSTILTAFVAALVVLVLG